MVDGNPFEDDKFESQAKACLRRGLESAMGRGSQGDGM
jgi:hypothetical protein